MSIKRIQSLINNLPAQINMPRSTRLRRKLTQNRITKIQPRRTHGIPPPIRRAIPTTLTTIANKQRQIGLLAVDSNNHLFTAVRVQVALELGMVHGHDVVCVHLVEREGIREGTFDISEVLVGEIGAAGLDLFYVVVVCAEALAFEDGGLGGCGGCEGREDQG